MKRLISLFVVFLVLFVTAQATMAAEGEQIKLNGKPRTKVRESDLLRRYPKGKSWVASSVLRVRGISKNKAWGFEGEQYVVYTNRYQSTIEVLDNELGELKLKIFVVDDSQQRFVSKRKMRVADFGDASPILVLAASKVGAVVLTNPYVGYIGPAIVVLGKIDAQYERTLTQLLKWSGIDLSRLSPNTELRIVENPTPLIGCSFEVVWTNGLGITLCRQIDGPVVVKLDKVQNLAQAVDPLFDLYIMPTLNRSIGDRWDVDAKHAANILSAHGATETGGKIKLKYLRDSKHDGQACRHLAIQGGTARITLDRDSEEDDVLATQIQGKILYDKSHYLVLEANGTCHIDAEGTSKDHLLFEAKWQRDVDVEFRYEAKVLSNGSK